MRQAMSSERLQASWHFGARSVLGRGSIFLRTGSRRPTTSSKSFRGQSCLAVAHKVMAGRYLYTLIIAIDANFRLKRRAISSDARDPPLGSGWGYFVERDGYREWLLDHVDEEEVSPLLIHMA